MTEKKTWVEPELIVLVRGKPEEAVLDGCKDLDAGNGYMITENGCNSKPLDSCFQCCAGCAS